MKKLLRNALIFGLVALMLCGSFTTVFADEVPATEGTTQAPVEAPVVTKPVKLVKINSITTDANARVKIHFAKSVDYAAKPTVCVKDEAGKAITSTIIAKDKNCLTLKLTGATCNKTYTVAINGVKVKDEKDFMNVTGTFKIRNLKTRVKAYRLPKIKVKKNTVIKVKCNQKIFLDKAVKVCVTDRAGKVYAAKIIKKNSKQIFVSVTGLSKKKPYTIIITGIKTKSEAIYGTLTVPFTTK